MAAAAKSQSFLPIIERIDAFPYIQNDPAQYREFIKSFYYFMIEDYAKPFGYVHVNRVQATTWPPYWRFNHTARTLTLTGTNSLESRTALLRDTLYSAHLEGKIKSLRKWSEETFSVYGRDNERFMDIPMIGAGFYGVVCTGVSLIAWTGAAGHRRYWVQKRASWKSVYPGKLDSTVGGNLRAGELPVEGMIREANEEASIPYDLSRRELKACGTISYHLVFDADLTPASCPHIFYAYELELPEGCVPKPNDGEVELFVSMSQEEVWQALFEDDFKPIVAVQWLAHFYRHGIMTAENEKNFVEIIARLHRKHDLFVAEEL